MGVWSALCGGESSADVKVTEKIDENESFENLRYYLDINKRQHHKIKYPLDELNFTTKIGKTEYEVSTSFDISGKHTLLEQFKNLILS